MRRQTAAIFSLMVTMMVMAVQGSGQTAELAPSAVSPPGIFMLRDNVEGSTCSAFAVTPDGLLFTALHCLRNCLRSQGRMESASSPFIGLAGFDVARDPQAPVSCPDLSIPALGVRGLTVVATGASLIQYDVSFFSLYQPYLAEIQAKGFGAMNEDYGLIQVAVATPVCGKLSATDIRPNAHLAALGFQQQEAQPDLFIYDETPGFRYSSVGQSAYARSVSGPEFQKYAAGLFGTTDLIYSSAPIKEGQSGGPVINEQREIAGLVSGHTTDGQRVSELFAVPLSHVMDKLPVGLAQNIRFKNALCRSSF